MKLTRHKRNDTIEKAIAKLMIMIQYDQSNYYALIML